MSFAVILARANGPAALARATGMSVAAAKQANRRKRIAARHWPKLVAAGLATADELLAAAAPTSSEGET